MKIKAPAAAVMHTHTAACGMGRVLKMIKLPALLVGLTFTKTSSLLLYGNFHQNGSCAAEKNHCVAPCWVFQSERYKYKMRIFPLTVFPLYPPPSSWLQCRSLSTWNGEQQSRLAMIRRGGSPALEAWSLFQKGSSCVHFFIRCTHFLWEKDSRYLRSFRGFFPKH